MKERIMTQLHAIVSGGAEELCEEMAEHLTISPAEVRRRCSIVQTSILHHYSELSVCTIDSFVHRLVRTFAHDLRLPMKFDVMIDNQQIVQTAVDELLSRAGSEGEEALTEILCAYTHSRMDNGKSYKLESEIADLAKELFKEESPRYLAELEKVKFDDFLQIYRWLRDQCRDMEKRLQAASEELIEALGSAGLTADDFPYKRSGALSLFLRLAEGDFTKLNEPHKRTDEAYNKGLSGSKTTPDIKARMERVFPAYQQAYKVVTKIIEEELPLYNSRQLLLGNLYGLALMSRLSEIKDSYYKENEIVHISEFNQRIAEEVMNEPAPFIYERIGSRYYNYLIDEFQDTSKLQWSNFLPLLDEAMTHLFSDDTAVPGTQSLVVGDGKQAIYRFRQGDVRQFMMLPTVESRLHGHSLATNAVIEPLDRNFRTLSNIVEFNNRLFEWIVRDRFAATNPELSKLYLGDGATADLVQTPVKPGGYVQLTFTEKEEIFSTILSTIRHQVDDLRYSYGDIMVLARDNETLVRISDYITAHSANRPIPIVSSESFLLSHSREVLLLQALLEYIFNPTNRLAALQVVRLYEGPTIANGAAILSEWALRDSHYDLATLLGPVFDVERLRSMPLYDLCETLIRFFIPNGRSNRFLATFMNVVNCFAQRGRADLGDFVTYLSEKLERLSSATATDLDAVQLMTIHKAKGLESKIVLVALPDKRTPVSKLWVDVGEEHREEIRLPVAFVNSQKNSTIFDRTFDEESRLSDMDRINVLYVAMTRPEEKLFVICEGVNTSKESNSNIALLRDFAERDEKTTKKETLTATYFIGADTAKSATQKEEDTPSTIEVTSIVFPEWESRTTIAQQSAAELSPFDEDNRRYGILIHDLLSQIRTAEDVDPVVDSYCDDNDLSATIRDDVRHRITTMIQRDDNKRFFDPTNPIKCEASIAAYGKVRRPDRIVFAEEATYVVDFKTGVRDERRHKKYLRQVSGYARLLATMGYPKVTPVIIYL